MGFACPSSDRLHDHCFYRSIRTFDRVVLRRMRWRIEYAMKSFSNCADLNCVPLSETTIFGHPWRNTIFSVTAYVTAGRSQRRRRNSTHFEKQFYIAKSHAFSFFDFESGLIKSMETCCHGLSIVFACKNPASFTCRTLCCKQFLQCRTYCVISRAIPGQYYIFIIRVSFCDFQVPGRCLVMIDT